MQWLEKESTGNTQQSFDDVKKKRYSKRYRILEENPARENRIPTD